MRNIYFLPVSSVIIGVTGKVESKAWEEEIDAVNSMSSVERTIQKVKRKCFDMKLDTKKCINGQHTKNPYQPQETAVVTVLCLHCLRATEPWT